MSSSTTHSAQWHDQPGFGIALFVINLILMAVMGAMVKTLSVSYPLTEILSYRFICAMLAFAITLPSVGGLAGLKTSRPFGHAVRTVSGIVSLGLLYFALSTIPLADATALVYSAPIFIVVFSIPLLGETIGWRRWSAVLLGFIGVILIAQPGASMNIGTLAGIGSAIGAALVSIFLRRLSKTEKTVTIGFYYNFTGTLVYTGWAISIGWVMPLASDALLIAAFGLLAGLQQWALNHSHRYAEASMLAPFEYLILIFAALLGYVFWAEVPSFTTWIGAAIIVASGLFIIARKRAIGQT
ncbi:MAG: DMT family transporter [Pseudomonadota bacterium]